MPKQPQWSITIDGYHRFVVDKFVDLLGTSRSDVVESWVRSWVSDHPEQVEQAEASLRDWKKARSRGNEEGSDEAT